MKFFVLHIYSICSNDNCYHLLDMWYIFKSVNHLRSFGGKRSRAYKMRITIAKEQPPKIIRLKRDISKYNTIFMIRKRTHDMQPHAVFQIAFNPILSTPWSFMHILKSNKQGKQHIHVSIILYVKNHLFLCFSIEKYIFTILL